MCTNHNRKPAHLEYAGGKSPRQRIWEKIRAYHAGQAEPFTLNRLVADLPGTIHKDTTKTYLKSLVAARYVIRLTGNDERFILTRDNGVEAPRVRKDGSEVTQGRAQENLWRTLRSLNHTVSYHELAAMASTQDYPVSPEFARDYLGNLLKAKYVNRIGKKYHLNPARNTGPRPPMIQRISQIFDPNLGKVVWKQEPADE
jgi:hypothetical protein